MKTNLRKNNLTATIIMKTQNKLRTAPHINYVLGFWLIIASCRMPARLLSLLIMIGGVTANSFSQGTWPWAKQSHGVTQGVGTCNNIDSDPSGNVYITGSFTGSAITFGTYTLSNEKAFFLVKYDASGNEQWAINPTGQCSGQSVTADALGNSIVVGNFIGSITFGTYTLSTNNASDGDILVVKYDPSGNVLWAKGVGGTGFDSDIAYYAVADVSGNIYITGSYFSPSITFGSTTLTGPSNFMAKYDASGNVLWAKNTYVYPPYLAVDNTGNNVYLAGGGAAVSAGAQFDSWLVKYDASGNLLWTRTSVQGWKCKATSVAVDPTTGDVYVAGTVHETGSPLVSFGSFSFNNFEMWDGFLVRYSASGNEQCLFHIADYTPGKNFIQQMDVAVDRSGYVYIAGLEATTFGVNIGSSYFIPPVSGGSYPMFLAILDPDCNAICHDVLTEGAGGQLSNVYVTSNPFGAGDVYVQGGLSANRTFNVGTTTLTSGVENDTWVGKYVKCESTSADVLDMDMEFGVYPNPAANQLTVYGLQVKAGTSIEIYNILGEKVYSDRSGINSDRIGTKSEIRIDISSLAKGAYIVQLITEEKKYRAMVIKE